jgi:poly(ADP-ribose) glycohydrolase
LKRDIIGIDAIVGFRGGGQFSSKMFERDLNKAFIGFSHDGTKEIATGNWGCGAFGGDLHLKAFQQM